MISQSVTNRCDMEPAGCAVVVWLLLRQGATVHAIYYCYECESDEDIYSKTFEYMICSSLHAGRWCMIDYAAPSSMPTPRAICSVKVACGHKVHKLCLVSLAATSVDMNHRHALYRLLLVSTTRGA